MNDSIYCYETSLPEVSMHTGLLQILFKPLSDLRKTLNPVLRLSASGEIMILIMEDILQNSVSILNSL